MKSDKPGKPIAAATSPREARPAGAAPTPALKRPAPSRVRPDEWRGTRRNAAINDALVAKLKVLSARGKSLAQIADKLGISVGRARNISAEIRLGKK